RLETVLLCGVVRRRRVAIGKDDKDYNDDKDDEVGFFSGSSSTQSGFYHKFPFIERGFSIKKGVQ
ncbi:MAG: hypothetical protein U1C97_00675, partial [Candidatus Gracilibacteria bacterium]|nr:hypothetical protein [Candidatus Gracilibacteria bacterium]